MSDATKVAVIYYSATGTTHRMAVEAARAAEEAGAETRLRKVPELAPDEAVRANAAWHAHRQETQDVPEAGLDDVGWADAVIFGTPTRFGVMSAQLKQFLDGCGPLWGEGRLVNKVFAGFCSTSTPHGGQEATLLSMFTVFYHWGGIVVTPGYVEPSQFVAGNPYGASHTSSRGSAPPDETALTATRLTVRRAVQISRALTHGLVMA